MIKSTVKDNVGMLIEQLHITLHADKKIWFPIILVLKVPSGELRHLNCDTLEQTLTRLGLQQYLDTLQAENLDLESLVINTHNWHTH